MVKIAMCSRMVALAYALVVLVVVSFEATSAAAPTASFIDARGLAFESQDAFCRFHCSATHVAQAYRELQETSECSHAKCAAYISSPRQRKRERVLQTNDVKSYSFDGDTGNSSDAAASIHAEANLNDNKNVQTIDFVTCQSVAANAQNKVSLSIGDLSTSAFAGFYDAFFAAYDAMISSADATYDACQLQFFQDQLLAKDTSKSAQNNNKEEETTNLIKPMLVRLHAHQDELACLHEMRSIWSHDDEGLTPFLTRSDQGNANATVLLLHIPKEIGEKIVDLDCIQSVVQLPAILKLTPFARASVSLARDATLANGGGPSLEVRLVKGSTSLASVVVARLQRRIQDATGIQNALNNRSDDATTRVFTLQALDDFSTWTKALALILDDDAVEWVDLKTSLTTGALAPGVSFEQRLMTANEGEARGLRDISSFAETASRRLDAYVQDLVGAKEVRAKNITGSGIVVGVTDTGLYINHDQFDQSSRAIYGQTDLSARKVVLYKAFGNSVDESEQIVCGHGTHVSGIVAGSSMTKTNEDLGIAHSARIAFMDIGKQSPTCAGQKGCEVKLETPGEVEALMKDQVDAGARIFSFSWGTGGNDYNAQSRDLDNYVYNNPEVLIIVAAGNSGDKGSHSISSPSGAKNVISVGASLNDAASFVKTPCASVLNKQTVASFSSIGPTLDGRQKPDLVAPGMTIESSRSEAPGVTVKSAALCPLQGTSQSTPVVAGMAVLLFEWLRDGWWKNGVKNLTFGMKNIPASLLKALILHSGEKMSRRLVAPRNGVTSCVAMENAAIPLTSYPDMSQGYGKPTLANLVAFEDSQGAGVYFFPNSTEGSEPRVVEGQQTGFTFVLKEQANLRVTIVWSDPAGSVGGKQALQNDLDLYVTIPKTDKKFYPLSGNGARDSVNNVEMVEVSYDEIIAELKKQNVKYDESVGVTVEAVVYGMSVKAGAKGGQPFALVASASPSSVETANTLSEAKATFWQPWMTIGTIVGGTIVVLFAIAVGYRMKARAEEDDFKPMAPLPPPAQRAQPHQRAQPQRAPAGPPPAAAPRRGPRPMANDTNYQGGAILYDGGGGAAAATSSFSNVTTSYTSRQGQGQGQGATSSFRNATTSQTSRQGQGQGQGATSSFRNPTTSYTSRQGQGGDGRGGPIQQPVSHNRPNRAPSNSRQNPERQRL